MKIEREKLFSVPELKNHGWTDSLIKKFLQTPDQTQNNPHFRSGPPMKLFLVKRVNKIEKTSDFISDFETAANRSNIMTSVAEKKKQALLQKISAMPVKVNFVESTLLNSKAHEHYLFRQSLQQNDNPSEEFFENFDVTKEREFTERIKFNYVRHELTDYDKSLKEQARKIGAVDARSLIRQKICEAILELFPELSKAVKIYLARKSVIFSPD